MFFNSNDTIRQPRLSICLPCLGRPQRTMRVFEQIINQDTNDWELHFIGDGCPRFVELVNSEYFTQCKDKIEKEGNVIIYENYEHKGGYGYNIRNNFKRKATGKYSIYVDNDDCIESNHFRNYLSGIENTTYDFVYFNSIIEPIKSIRNTELISGKIGHSEIIVRTEFLRNMPEQDPNYEHDWQLIHNMIKLGANYVKAEYKPPTYIVKSIQSHRELNID